MTKINLDLKPFPTQDFVYIAMPPQPRDFGAVPLPKIHINKLDPDTLSALCDDFRKSIFEIAGHQDPRENKDEN